MSNQSATDDKTALINVFKNCLNILRDNEGLIGDKALRTMSFLLILKMIEPHFGNEIDIDDYQYDFTHYEDSIVDNHKKKLLEMVRFSNLAQEKEDNIPQLMKCLWDDILSCHPTTKKVFLKEKGFDIQHKSTYKKIIEKLNSVDLVNTKYDVLGNAYEEVIQGIMTGKVLGQFFTQPLIKKMMVKLIDPQIHADGTIDTCCDPTMGTGGFLITYLQHLLQQAESKNIKPDWDFIKTEGLYGKELEPDTYQLAVSNMLISSGHMFDGLEKGDSIRVPITRKFDNILANPPFGIKGLRYDDFESPLKNEYIPIKSENAVSLFLQAIIYMVKVEGKCAVVLPDGQDLFSKTNKTLVAVREYLMKTCDLKEIIYLPSGLFTYTSIKTCVFYFVKKVEGVDVLETKIKVSKTQKETGRDYTFTKEHQTRVVMFYNYDHIEDAKTLIIEVPIEKISQNSYSLNYAEYMKVEIKEIYSDNVVVKTLGEMCDFQNGFAFKPSQYEKQSETNNGILQIKSIQNGVIDVTKITEFYGRDDKYKKFEISKNDILIGLTGYAGKMGMYTLDHTSYLNQRVAKITCKDIGILHPKYLYYWYICCDIEKTVLSLSNGTAQPNISTNEISNIKIPIPTPERQQEIIEYLDFIYEKANKTSNEKILELKKLNEFCLKNQKIFGDNDMKTLGGVCYFQNGFSFKSTDYEIQNDKNVGLLQIKSIQNGVIDVTKITEFYGRDDKYKKFEISKNDILIGLTGYAGKMGMYTLDHTSYLNQRVAKITCKDIGILHPKYLYYWYICCDIEKTVLSLSNGTAQPNISTNEISNIKIPIPTPERQQEIIEYCESNERLILQLKSEIEKNKKQAHPFIKSVMKESIVVYC
jgi:type I restriction enzyme S subunit